MLNMMNDSSSRVFPEFSLARLLKTVFEPKPGQRIGILIDLVDPKQVEGLLSSKIPRSRFSATPTTSSIKA